MSESAMKAIVLTEDDVPGAKLTNLPAESSVLELKRWLECHGELKKGNKPDLIKRVEGCIALGKKVDPKVDRGKWYDIKESSGSSDAASNSVAGARPTNLPEAGWKTFPSKNIPSMFNYGHVYYYLVESVSGMFMDETSDEDTDGPEIVDSSTAKPLRKGRKLLTSDFVENIQDNDDSINYYVRAHVHHSMKNEYPLNVATTISKISGAIKNATCTCKARALGKCAHITAVLLMVNDHTEKHGFIVEQPSTSQPCVWNKGGKRKKNASALHEATYKSSKMKRSNKELYKWDPRPVQYKNKTDKLLLHEFIVNLQSDTADNEGEMSMWESSLRFQYTDFEIDNTDKLYIQCLVDQFQSGLEEDIRKTTMGKHNAYQIPDTEQQSNSDGWFQARWSRITASICKRVCLMGERLVNGEGDSSKHQFYIFFK